MISRIRKMKIDNIQKNISLINFEIGYEIIAVIEYDQQKSKKSIILNKLYKSNEDEVWRDSGISVVVFEHELSDMSVKIFPIIDNIINELQ